MVGFFFLVVAVVAAVLLGVRDTVQARLWKEQLSVEDRIREIKDSAAFMIREFERVQAKFAEEIPSGGKRTAWVPVAIQYFSQLENLASLPTSTPKEALALAEDASQWERENRPKGIMISAWARDLAMLIQKRDLAIAVDPHDPQGG